MTACVSDIYTTGDFWQGDSMSYKIVTKNGIRDGFKCAVRPEHYKNISDAKWNDWKWQLTNNVQDLDVLDKLIQVSSDERDAFVKGQNMFKMGITPYYASLMDPNDPHCPVRMQAVPSKGELTILPTDLEDPLGEDRDMPVPGLTHRYPDRVLFYTSHVCAMFCRHCTRKRKVADPSSYAVDQQLEAGLAYIETHKEVRDVVISGGDALCSNDDRVEYILSRLRAMDHVEMLRIGTRVPVTNPMRITDDLVKIIRKYHPVYVNTHFNHPKECTREAFDAVARLADAGCVVSNQMVLLKGVNDDPKIVKQLNHTLLKMRVRPYYIFQCDMAQGISHFRTPVEAGINIMENLRGWTSGMAIPHFVIDAPGGGGKIPLLPNYVREHEGKKWVLRNFKNNEYIYWEP
jgi:lysine 2,3-aminomutase